MQGVEERRVLAGMDDLDASALHTESLNASTRKYYVPFAPDSILFKRCIPLICTTDNMEFLMLLYLHSSIAFAAFHSSLA